MTKKIRLAVLYGGTSSEHEVSVVSARSVFEAIDRDKYDPVAVAILRTGEWMLPERTPDQLVVSKGQLPSVDEREGRPVLLRRSERGSVLHAPGYAADEGPIDVVFPVLHGPGGEDGTVQGLLEILGVPYVGAGVAASAVGMDKSLQKPVLAAAGIPVTPWVTVREAEFGSDPQAQLRRALDTIGVPCFTKPASSGSSIGVSKCRTAEELRRGLDDALEHSKVALVETAVAGRELECAVLGNDDPQASVVGEIVPAHEFYDYEAKYMVEGSRLLIPADLAAEIGERIRSYSIAAFNAIGCAGMARVDFFLSQDAEIYLNEINTIPGFTPISMYPKLWEASGMAYPKLLDRLVELALERHAKRGGQ